MNIMEIWLRLGCPICSRKSFKISSYFPCELIALTCIRCGWSASPGRPGATTWGRWRGLSRAGGRRRCWAAHWPAGAQRGDSSLRPGRWEPSTGGESEMGMEGKCVPLLFWLIYIVKVYLQQDNDNIHITNVPHSSISVPSDTRLTLCTCWYTDRWWARRWAE